MGGHEPYLSVVVCTRNRSSRLTDGLSAILDLDAREGGWEMVIVDNGSTDDTREIAESVARRAPEIVRVVDEATVGLSSARNAGIRASRGEIIAYIDDDAFPAATWLSELAAAFEDEGVMCAGGPVEPIFEGGLPDWFRGRYLPYLTVWDRGDEDHELHYNEYPRGANMAFRREAFDRFGVFSTHLGRKAGSLLSCEETELCLRIERAGYRTVYASGARVRHHTPAARITRRWMERRFAAQGRSEAVIDWMHGGARGLVRGLRGHLARARASLGQRELAGELFVRCERRALRGYWTGCLSAPMTVPRYRPPDPAVELAPWP